MQPQVYKQMYQNEDTHWWYVARRKIVTRVIDKYVSKSENNRVLEVGCGSGGNLAFLSQYGKLYAVEQEETARIAANGRQICQVSPGSLPDQLPNYEPFDLICALDVLEHIEDDKECIQTLEQKLKPGGILLITVPAYQFLWSGHDVVNNHKRRYTKGGLLKLFNGTNLTIEYAGYFNTILFPGILLARFVKNLFAHEEEFDIKPSHPVTNRCLLTIFSTEQWLIPAISLPFGISVMAVVKKLK